MSFSNRPQQYPAYICENGDVIASMSLVCPDKFCIKCGAKVISRCPHCATVIRGCINEGFSYTRNYIAPAYCPSCGKPYPWTKRKLDKAARILKKQSAISPKDREELLPLIPDIVADTPNTKVAASKIQEILQKVGAHAGDGLLQFIKEFGCAFILKLLGL